MNRGRLTVSVILLLAVASLCLGLVTVSGTGTWSKSWPKELERFRKQTKTFGVAHGIQEDVHEIRFHKREEFEAAWPYILKLKSKGAPLILESSPSYYAVSGSTAETGVRVICPPGGGVYSKRDGKDLKVGPPWPDSIKTSSGALPEYVVAGPDDWVPAGDQSRRSGFQVRARVDVVLITDGKVVDLNRIPLPPDTPIVDNRFR